MRWCCLKIRPCIWVGITITEVWNTAWQQCRGEMLLLKKFEKPNRMRGIAVAMTSQLPWYKWVLESGKVYSAQGHEKHGKPNTNNPHSLKQRLSRNMILKPTVGLQTQWVLRRFLTMHFSGVIQVHKADIPIKVTGPEEECAQKTQKQFYLFSKKAFD